MCFAFKAQVFKQCNTYTCFAAIYSIRETPMSTEVENSWTKLEKEYLQSLEDGDKLRAESTLKKLLHRFPGSCARTKNLEALKYETFASDHEQLLKQLSFYKSELLKAPENIVSIAK